MDKLRAIEWFVRLADLGSFTLVAEHAHTSKSMISKEISRLEQTLGVRLLHRTTRNLRLTQAGEGYLPRARQILNQLSEADNFAQQLQQTPKGRLKVNVPMALGITDLGPMFAEFMQHYPEIELDVHLSDGDIDLVEQGFDLGLRASSQALDSNYVGRPLTHFSYHICAAADYFDHHPAIIKPSDLRQHNCFEYSYFRSKNTWPIDDGVVINGTLRANSVLFMLAAIRAGHGLGMVPDFLCRDELKTGELIQVLPQAKKPQLTLYAMYPARHFVPARVLQCIEFLQQKFNH
ncbi:transcriptional regulator [Bacterioplanes sanyensis]|uniref:LysR family transcriptional regulator n=1 Tax=Bacterioplanes sanyensis TaxID=1249553 RepID=UPI001671A260|nr:LysR family transcriptional regulator [Bacterioplanes sanyensis]GGY56947.1 transcriptional regulator [Bacterioplanes sanyensis]